MARRKKPVDENGVPYEQYFAGYEVYDKLGEEKGITSWAATDLRLGREVLLKEMEPDVKIREDLVEDFFSSVGSIARLKHPNILRGLDTGRSGNKFYFVQEYITGEKLSAILQDGNKLDEERCLEITEQLLLAIDYIYEEGFVHGNITPENVILGRNGEIKLSDLGFPVDIQFATVEDFAKTYPTYKAPEMFEDDAYSDTGSDLYSLGICIYQMITGRLPYGGVDADEIIKKHIEETFPPLKEIVPGISDTLVKVIEQLLIKDTADRPMEPREIIELIYEHPYFAEKAEALRKTEEGLAEKDRAEEDKEDSEVYDSEEKEDTPEKNDDNNSDSGKNES
jgi:serine/threonine-protein kinase